MTRLRGPCCSQAPGDECLGLSQNPGAGRPCPGLQRWCWDTGLGLEGCGPTAAEFGASKYWPFAGEPPGFFLDQACALSCFFSRIITLFYRFHTPPRKSGLVRGPALLSPGWTWCYQGHKGTRSLHLPGRSQDGTQSVWFKCHRPASQEPSVLMLSHQTYGNWGKQNQHVW